MRTELLELHIAPHHRGRQVGIRFRIDGLPWWFNYVAEDQEDAERWLDDARQRVRQGFAPDKISVPEGCPLRPAESFLTSERSPS